MKYILIGFIFFYNAISLSAQNSELFNKIWKIESMYAEVNSTFTYTYQNNSPDNISDFSFLELTFTEDGNLKNKLEDGSDEAGVWNFIDNTDSISVNGNTVMVELLDASNFVIRVSNMELINENGDLGLIHYYQHFISEGSTSVNSSLLEKAIAVFPNPASKEITIDFKDLDLSTLRDLKVFNTIGQMVHFEDLQAQARTIQLNISTFSAGLYIIEVTNKTNTKIGLKKVNILR